MFARFMDEKLLGIQRHSQNTTENSNNNNNENEVLSLFAKVVELASHIDEKDLFERYNAAMMWLMLC